MQSVPISAHQETLGMIYFARMIDKIRLHADENLRADFCGNLGKGFDERCVNFLRVDYAALVARVAAGGNDEEILKWCFESGRALSEGDVYVWNEYLRKVGWNDSYAEILARRKKESGLEGHDHVNTIVDYFDYDEGRKS